MSGLKTWLAVRRSRALRRRLAREKARERRDLKRGLLALHVMDTTAPAGRRKRRMAWPN